MKITGVKTTLYQYRHSRRMGTARNPGGTDRSTRCLVELQTDTGLSGIGVSCGRARHEIDSLAGDVLLGQDALGVTGLWQRMVESNHQRGQTGLLAVAAAVLDGALWDLKAKANNEPLWKTLGAAPPRVNAYASDLGLPLDDGELSDWYKVMSRDYGFRGGKLQVGGDQETDLRRLALVREALYRGAQEPVLMIDADEVWLPKQAIRRIKEMERSFDLTWVEAPAPRWDFPGMKRVSDSVRAAVCTGGYLTSRGDFLPHFNQHSLDIVCIDPARVGITGALQLADAAYGYELPVTLPAAPGNINAHLAGAMPYFMSLEVTEPEPRGDVFTTDVRIEDGWALIGDRPGNGLAVDREALASAAVEILPEDDRVRTEDAT
jgi:L-alanine-DL-glutamate epimerase-like enolase superfamily enzyme